MTGPNHEANTPVEGEGIVIERLWTVARQEALGS